MLAAALACVAALAVGAPTPSPPPRWVEDPAGFLSPTTRQALDARLESYERATGHQIVVWIGTTLSGAALDDWAVRTFAAWQLGRKGLDDGLAMFIFAGDRKIDIEVGYGLEDRVPDATAARIIREVMAPRLKAGDRDGAVTAGVDAVLAAIEGRPWTGGPASSTEPGAPSWSTWVLLGVLALGALLLLVKYPRAARWLFWTALASARWGGGSGGGRHGGGGRSGGGGARGGW